MPHGLFITGTSTGVGKTYIASGIAGALRAAGHRVGVYKPVASGCGLRDGKMVSPDAVALWHAAGQAGTLEDVCPQFFQAPLAPHLAARAEGKQVDGQKLREGIRFWIETSDVVLIEGAGGLMSPISDEDYNADLAAEFGFPLIVVAANSLGTINATLQTLITVRSFPKLRVAGVVLNSPIDASDDPSTESNADELRRRCDSPLLATVGFGGGFDLEVDWWSLASHT